MLYQFLLLQPKENDDDENENENVLI